MTKQIGPKYRPDVSNRDLYTFFANTHFKEKIIKKDGTESRYYKIHKGSKFNIGQTLFTKILERYFELVVEDILKAEDYKLPQRLGIIGIRKNKTKIKVDKNGKILTNAPIDFKSTQELWEKDPIAKKQKRLIRFLNYHTKGYIHRWYWDKYHANFQNKSAYSFIPSRKNARLLAKLLQDPNNDVDFYGRYNYNKKF